MSRRNNRVRGFGIAVITLCLCAATHAFSQVNKSGVEKKSDVPKAGVTHTSFGNTKEGLPVQLYTLTNKNGLVVKIMNFGGIITETHVPDRDGKMADVTLGFDNFASYEKGHPFFGALAGRYANRIAKGKFSLDGKEYTLAVNNGRNHLHGGNKGFDKCIWGAVPMEVNGDPSVELSLVSPDGDEGYPGKLDVKVVYTLTKDNQLVIDYTAKTDKPTVLNLTNHNYWNLAGEGNGDVLGQELTINGDQYTPTDPTQIPTGEIKNVKGTPFDFTTAHTIGERVAQTEGSPNGYDHNFLLKGGLTEKPKLAARVKEPKSGRVMEVWTTEPAVQLYTANHLDGKITGKAGRPYVKHGALCLETQHYPDSPNHEKFPSTVLRPGETFHSRTSYKFLTE
jgi:aldose 1-epimerase